VRPSIGAVHYAAGVVTDDHLAQLREHIEASLPDYMSDLERLVNIECGSYNKEGVDEVGRWFADQLEDLGARITLEAHPELGDTVVAEFEGSGQGHGVLVGHLDTVFPDGTVAQRPFTVRDGLAFGPGVDDMKGGLLGGLYALRAIRALSAASPDHWLPFRRLTFVTNPDEELGSPSSTEIIRRAAQGADVAFVLESARENGDIVSARKGIADYVLRMTGRAAHAGIEPHKGRNAVLEAAHKTLALTALNGRWPGVTVNVGVVRGGTRPNVVAEWAELEIDVRGKTSAEMADVEAAIHEIADASAVRDITTTVTRRANWAPMEKTGGTAVLADQAIELARRIGFELKDAATGGASDANTLSGMGIATLDGLGPVGGADHAPGEYLEIESIVPRTTLLATLLLTAIESVAGESAAPAALPSAAPEG
jgi:glutamate carboxypeptidase